MTKTTVTPLWRGSDIDEDRDSSTTCWLVAGETRDPPKIVTPAERDAMKPSVTRTTLGQCKGGDFVYIGGAAPSHELQLYEVVPA